MYPWGNAYYNTSACGGSAYSKETSFCWVRECNVAAPPADCFAGNVLCQHGPDECTADLIEACAISHYPDPKQFGAFVMCFEGKKQSSLDMAEFCATSVGLDYGPIAECLQDKNESTKLDVMNAMATAKLGTAKLGTPWVLLDGEHVETDGLLRQVCAKLTPPQPPGCSSVMLQESHLHSSKPRLC